MKKACVFLILAICGLFLIDLARNTWGSDLGVFGPKTYVRETGKPQVFIDTCSLSDPGGSFKLVVQNGKDGKNRVSSALIWINGKQILGPSDFNQQVEVITKSISLKKGNEIKVELRSKPGSFIAVSILGEMENHPPVANAGPAQTLSLTAGQTAIDVILDGSASRDPDGNIVSYKWSGTPDPDDVEKPTVSLGPGAYIFTLVVTDDQGAVSSSSTVKVNILSAPQIFPLPRVTSDEIVLIRGRALPDAEIIIVSLSGPVETLGTTLTGVDLFEIPINLNMGPNQLQVFVGMNGVTSEPAAVNVTHAEPTLTLLAITPETGSSGSILTLTGSGFTPAPKTMGVYFKGTAQEQQGIVLEATGTTMKVSVPFIFLDTDDSQVMVYVYDTSHLSNKVGFHVLPAQDPTPDQIGNETARQFDLLIVQVQRLRVKAEMLMKPFVPTDQWVLLEENLRRMETFFQEVRSDLTATEGAYYDAAIRSRADAVFGSETFLTVIKDLEAVNEIISHSGWSEAACNINNVKEYLGTAVDVVLGLDIAVWAAESVCFFVCPWAVGPLGVVGGILSTAYNIMSSIYELLDTMPTGIRQGTWQLEVKGPYEGTNPHIFFTHTTTELHLWVDFSNGTVNVFRSGMVGLGRAVLQLFDIDVYHINTTVATNFKVQNDDSNFPNLIAQAPPMGTEADHHALNTQTTEADTALQIDSLCGAENSPFRYDERFGVKILAAPIIYDDGLYFDGSSLWVQGLGFSTRCCDQEPCPAGAEFQVYWNGQLVSCNCIADLSVGNTEDGKDGFHTQCSIFHEPGRLSVALVKEGENDRYGPSVSLKPNPYYPPAIYSVVPSSAYVNDMIAVIGEHFPPYPEDIEIFFVMPYIPGVDKPIIHPLSVRALPEGGQILTFMIPEELHAYEGTTINFSITWTGSQVVPSTVVGPVSSEFFLKPSESTAELDHDLVAFGQARSDLNTAIVADIDGDGENDLILGFPEENGVGSVKIAFGPLRGVSLTTGQKYIDFANRGLDRQWDVEIVGYDDRMACNRRRIGNSLAVGDINDDGIMDLVIGTTDQREDDEHGYDVYTSCDDRVHMSANIHAGNVFVFYGRTRDLWLSKEDNIFRIYRPGGETDADLIFVGDDDRELGYQVATGDLNGDGYADIVISAPTDSINPLTPNDKVAAVYVIFGRKTWHGKYDVQNVSNAVITGQDIYQGLNDPEHKYKGDGLGKGLAIGDVNGDGIADLLIGAPQYMIQHGPAPDYVYGVAGGYRQGAAYLFYGGPSFGGDFEVGPYGNQELLFLGPKWPSNEHASIGSAILIADLNNDGKGEIVFGAPHATLNHTFTAPPGFQYSISQADIGRIYVINGAKVPNGGKVSVEDFADLVVNGSFRMGEFGTSLAAGDVNGDGIKDLLVGSPKSVTDPSWNILEVHGNVWGLHGSANPEWLEGEQDIIQLQDRSGDYGFVVDDFLISGLKSGEGFPTFGKFITTGDLSPYVGDDVLVIQPWIAAPNYENPSLLRPGAGMLFVFYEGSNILKPVADIAVKPSNVDLGEIPTGAGTDRTVYIENEGHAPLHVYGVKYSGDSAFVVTSSSVPFIIPPFERRGIIVEFYPLELKSYTGTITISSNDAEERTTTVVVQGKGVQSAPAPRIVVSPGVLLFSEGKTELSAAVKNTGDAWLIWATNLTSALPGWISSISPPVGYSQYAQPGQTGDVTVTVNRQGLNAGTYVYEFRIVSNAQEPYPTIMAVLVVAETPSALVNPPSLDFGNSSTPASLNITNTGNVALSWDISVGGLPGWLSVSPASGVTAVGAASPVNVNVSRADLDSGTYNHTLSITSNGGNASIPVTMTVNPPVLSVSAAGISFGDTGKTTSFTISNAGDGRLIWNMTTGFPGWLSVIPTSGEARSGSPSTVNVTVSRNMVPVGDYSHTISITSNGGAAIVQIEMTVQGQALVVTPTELDFGTGLIESSFTIRNNSNFILNWQITGTPPSWLTEIAPLSNGLSPGGSSTVTVKVDRTGFAPGTYEYSIPVSSNSGSGTIHVSMTVPQPQAATWAKTYGNGKWDEVVALLATHDVGGNHDGYVIASNNNSGISSQGRILKVNITGEVQWDNLYGVGDVNGYDHYIRSVRLTSDGGYIVAGTALSNYRNNVWVLKLGAGGNIKKQWAYGFPNSGDAWADDIQETSDGYVLSGGINPVGTIQKVLVVKLDFDGGIQWQKTYDFVGSFQSGGGSIRKTGDGDYIVLVRVINSINGPYYYGILKLHENGSLDWQKLYGSVGWGDHVSGVEQASDGDYIVVGEYTLSNNWGDSGIWVMRLSPNGSTIRWQHAYRGSWTSTSSPQIKDDAVVIPGVVENDAFVMKINAGDGSIIWQKQYGAPGAYGDLVPNDAATSIVAVPEGGYLVAGQTISFTSDAANSGMFNNDELWLFKIDESGALGCELDWDASVQAVDTALTVTTPSVTVGDAALSSVYSGVGSENTGAEVDTVCPGPALSLSSTSLEFGSSATEETVIFTNSGTGTLTWILEYDYHTWPSWLRIRPQAATLREGEFSEVTFRVNRTGLASGLYEYTPTFWSNGGMGSVLVRITVP